MLSSDWIDHFTKAAFSAELIREKLSNYRQNMRRIFEEQGRLVLYPNNEVTCFKYKNTTYFNPNFEKLAANKIEVNLRHLHPSLGKKVNEIEAEFTEIGLNTRRFEAYIKRACNFFNLNLYSPISEIIPDVSVMNHALIWYAIKCIPDCFDNMAENYTDSLEQTIHTCKTAFPADCKINLEKVITDGANEFKEKEQSTIDTFKLLMFKTSILGI